MAPVLLHARPKKTKRGSGPETRKREKNHSQFLICFSRICSSGNDNRSNPNTFLFLYCLNQPFLRKGIIAFKNCSVRAYLYIFNTEKVQTGKTPYTNLTLHCTSGDNPLVDTQQISAAAQIIKNGGLVAFPTETVYGLGADAFNQESVAKIFEVKKRPRFDPLIVHIDSEQWLEKLTLPPPPKAVELIQAFWPGPLTVVLPKRLIIGDIVTSGLSGVAVRMPSNLIALSLIKAAGVPLAAPSANLFGSVSPTQASHVEEQLGGGTEMILDGGPCSVGIESTVLSFMDEVPVLLRAGGVELEEIQRLIGEVRVALPDEMISNSPGRCDRHYSPGTPLVLIKNTDMISGEKRSGVISLFPVDKKDVPGSVAATETLSGSGDLREAACNLFAAMRKLDTLGLEVIYALPIPTEGLGLAINDRLSRASAKRE